MNKLITHLEATPLHLSFLTVFSFIFLRIFFEPLEAVRRSGFRLGYGEFNYPAVIQYFIHFPFFYLSLFLLLVMVIAITIKEEIKKVTGVGSVGLGLILFVPIIDWIVGGGYLLTYPLRLKTFFIHFLNPWQSLVPIGVSPGQRVIIILIAFLIAFYAYLKRKRLALALSLFVIPLGIIIFWGALPTIIALDKPEDVYLTGGVLNSDQQKFAIIFALLLFCLFFIYYRLLNQASFKILINSLRWERMLFYSGIGIFGFILAKRGQLAISGLFDLLGLVLLVLSLALGFQSAQVINDFFDIESDRLSRKRNPLGQGIEKNYYLIWGFCLITLSLTFALIINYFCFLLMFSFLLLSIIYSVPPIRLKRVPLLSTFILAVAAILGIAMGCSLFWGNYALSVIPKRILIPTLLGITLGFIAKDIQDVNGDRITRVITLPSLFYKDSIVGRLPIAIIIGISYSCYIIFIPKVWIGAVIFSLLTISYTIFIKKPKEWFYFVMLYSFGVYLLILLKSV
uniref:Uncharacterized protein n=1 Tax=candidate division WOR-3 bacterium TaxID=2052148 RepID=A0A7C6ECP7_UNCW3